MKRTFIAAGLAVVLSACGSSDKNDKTTGNPFLTEFTTPFGVPPFDKITLADYKPAFLQGMEEQKREIEAIVNQRSIPDFENTIDALEQSGKLLKRVSKVF